MATIVRLIKGQCTAESRSINHVHVMPQRAYARFIGVNQSRGRCRPEGGTCPSMIVGLKSRMSKAPKG